MISPDENLLPSREEAALWAARLEGGNMTDADRAALQAWLDTAPEHQAALAQFRKLSAELTPGLPGIFESIEISQATLRRNRLRQRAWGSGALVTMAALLVLMLQGPETIDTARAERRATTLADGSRVELNANTELQVHLGRAERRVVLVRGEALFQIAKDPSRPFVVDTACGRVSVTGTVFGVRSAVDKKVDVTVMEGRVEVQLEQRPDQRRSLTPDMQALLRTDSLAVVTLPPGTATDAAAWREGQVVFDDTPLDEAMAHFSSYHDRAITVDPAVADLRLGGRYSLDDLEMLLRSLPSVLPIRVDRRGSAIFLRTQ